MKKTTLFLTIAILLFVSACTTTIQPTTSDTTTADATASQTSDAKVFNVEAFQFSYTPATIEVKKGDTVTLKLSTRDVPHSLAITDYNVNVQAYPDAPGEQTFTADKAGEFTWRCKTPCGAGHTGMTGKLMVRE